jgi:hypothetical protein
VKTVILNFTKEERTSVLGQAKFEEPELVRCCYVNQLGFQDIYIHESTFARIYYEEFQSPAQPCPEKCVENI